LVRKDCYRIDYEYIYLPKGLKYRGMLKWIGKPGRLEIAYNEVDEVLYVWVGKRWGWGVWKTSSINAE
jgi:hypothetical protein